jgi:predicted permease
MSTLFEQLSREATLAWRRIRAAPGPTVFAIVTLALGIGVTVATYSVIYSGLWRPLGIVDESRVVLLGRQNSPVPRSALVSWSDYQDFLREQRGFAGVAAWTSFGTVLVGRGSAELVEGEAVTGSYFPVLDVRAAMGRAIDPDDDRAGAPLVVVLSDATWRDQFAADPAIVGKTVKMADREFQVIGVTPPGFRGVHPDGFIARALWVPIASAPRNGGPLARLLAYGPGSGTFTVGIRSGAGQTRATTADEITATGRRLDVSAPLPPRRIPGSGLQPVLRYWTGLAISDDQALNEQDAVGRLIVGLPALVLLIACTNIANLVLSRGAARRHDFAIRRALGASRFRLIREQMVEQSAIVLVGGVGGVLVARWLVRIAAGIARDNLEPFLRGVRFDWTLDAGVLVSAAVAVLLCIVVSGLVPALHLTRDSLRSVLDQGGTAATPRWRGRANLVALQVGVSVGLFLVAVIFVRMLLDDSLFKRNFTVTPGSEQVAVTTIPFGMQQRDEVTGAATVDQILQALHRSPDVTAAAVASNHPFGRTFGLGNYFEVSVADPDRPFAPPANKGPGAHFTVSSPNFFAVVGTSIRFGRPFSQSDTRDSAPVAIVNEGLALDLFGVSDVAGRPMLMQVRDRTTTAPARTTTVTIVGVMAGAPIADRTGRHDAEIHVPYAQQYVPEIAVVARAPKGRPAPVESMRAAIKQVDPELAVTSVAAADLLERGPFAFIGYLASILTALASLALGMAMAGLYGVLSHVVARRTREMGIRIAIGATASRIIIMVFRDGFRPILEGLFIGLATATVFRVFLKTAMSAKEVAPVDPIACVIAGALVTVAGALACYLPARRAASVDPNVALRVL